MVIWAHLTKRDFLIRRATGKKTGENTVVVGSERLPKKVLKKFKKDLDNRLLLC